MYHVQSTTLPGPAYWSKGQHLKQQDDALQKATMTTDSLKERIESTSPPHHDPSWPAIVGGRCASLPPYFATTHDMAAMAITP